MIVIAWVCLGCAICPALLYIWNSFLFQEPPHLEDAPTHSNASHKSPGLNLKSLPPLSVLIPARNEEIGIAACIHSVLASQKIELEIVVLDDHSTDRTAEIVQNISLTDNRVRLEYAPNLPPDWCGKQHACFTLSKLARFDVFTFLDADVRLESDALARMMMFLQYSKAELVSGFPKQETGTSLEKLVIPLINWLLLCWLPFWLMRRLSWPALGAGCGQWFMTNRKAYEAINGHAAVKASLHDGLTLPRAYRRSGFMTDVCDATNLATCRMYRSANGVWNGFAKNAREGLASTGQIGFWTTVLIFGQIIPFILSALLLLQFNRLPLTNLDISPLATANITLLTILTITLAWLPRIHCAYRFRQSFLGALLHPIGMTALLAIQWFSIYRAVTRQPVGWKGRPTPFRSSDQAPILTEASSK